MIDVSTKKPLYVSTAGDAGPYIMVPVEQADDVCALLKANSIPHRVDEGVVSLDGKPEVTVVNLGQGSDADAVQKLLDNAS